MISYFDTSALIPLILGEPASERCSQLWNESVRVISTRLLYPEARAALAQAERMHRITAAQLTASVNELESIVTEIDYVEISDQVARAASPNGTATFRAPHAGGRVRPARVLELF